MVLVNITALVVWGQTVAPEVMSRGGYTIVHGARDVRSVKPVVKEGVIKTSNIITVK